MTKKNMSEDGMAASLDIHFFDCNCIVGQRADRRVGEPWSMVQLREDMAYYHVAEALVFHGTSRDYDPVAGNEEILRLLSGSENLHPVWCVLPPSTGELAEPSLFVNNLLLHHVEAVISFPRLHGYSLSAWSTGKLLAELDHYRIPLLLPFQEFDWNEIYDICRRYPSLPVITTGINYRQLRYLLPLWETCTNLYVDLAWMSVADLLPFLKSRGHLNKLLFGTNYPVYTPSAAVTMVTYADVTEEEKKQVGGSHLRAILDNIRKG